ncbi:unnamed protein product, partial [Owenia fusiformis]
SKYLLHASVQNQRSCSLVCSVLKLSSKNMPRSFLQTIRDYKEGSHHCEGSGHYVMTTRSGLSIRKTPIPQSNLPTSTKVTPPGDSYKVKRVMKDKPLSLLPIVTRHKLNEKRHLLLEAGERLDMKWTEDPNFYRARQRQPTSYLDYGSDSDDSTLTTDSGISSETGSFQNVTYPHSMISQGGSKGYTHPYSPLIDVVSVDEGDNMMTQTLNPASPSSSRRKQILGDRTRPSNHAQVQDYCSPIAGGSRALTGCCQTGLCGRPGCIKPTRGGGPEMFTASENLEFLKLQVQAHMYVTDTNGRRIHKCLVCDKVFSIFLAYSMHVRTHFKTKNRCPVCGKIFTRSWLLKGHMRVHTGERPFKCPYPNCPKAFADKSNLRSHQMIHTTKQKIHMCTGCNRAFAQKRYLHKHMLEVCKQQLPPDTQNDN